MTCEACESARHGVCATFFSHCQGCAARAASRSPQAHEARALGRQTPEYRDMLARLEVTHEEVKAAHAVDFEQNRDGLTA